jgi:hypothetical protein
MGPALPPTFADDAPAYAYSTAAGRQRVVQFPVTGYRIGPVHVTAAWWESAVPPVRDHLSPEPLATFQNVWHRQENSVMPKSPGRPRLNGRSDGAMK